MSVADGEFAGAVAVVTGGSRGIGAAAVRAFASAGADVAIASRDLQACSTLADEVASAYGVRALPFAYNASSWAQNNDLAEAAYTELGKVDVLVNNAGMSPLYSEITEVTESLYDKVMAVNLRGPFRLMAMIGSRMKSQGSGVIVNIGSVAADSPDPDALPYSAAKAGLHAMSEGFAKLLGPEVRVNTLHPGPILTDIAEQWPEGVREAHEQNALLGRCGTPDEVADAILFLASQRASYVTATALRVDGGFR